MSIIRFVKLQWMKRRLLLISLMLVSIMLFTLSISYNTVKSKLLNALTGDQYYTTFTIMLPGLNKLTPILISDMKTWEGVQEINALNSKKIIRDMKNETSQSGLDIPSLITDQPSILYHVRIDPFVSTENAERIRSKVLSYFNEGDATASPIKAPDLVARYQAGTILMMKHGTMILTILLVLLLVVLNAQLFFRISSDANILQSIYRARALSLKNYLVIQALILILAISLNILAGNFSFLVVLLWITVQSILALSLYGLWGKANK